jgi:hypothetical protein
MGCGLPFAQCGLARRCLFRIVAHPLRRRSRRLAGGGDCGYGGDLEQPAAAAAKRAAPLARGDGAPDASLPSPADVARRALDPRLPLQPGLIAYPVRLARGAARNTFCTLSSLLPGTLPVATDERDALVVHCLDTGEPIERQLGVEEALLTRVMGGRGHD